MSLFHAHSFLVAFLQCILSGFDNKENQEVFLFNQCQLQVRLAVSFNLWFDVDAGLLQFYERFLTGLFDFALGFLIFPPALRFSHGFPVFPSLKNPLNTGALSSKS